MLVLRPEVADFFEREIVRDLWLETSKEFGEGRRMEGKKEPEQIRSVMTGVKTTAIEG